MELTSKHLRARKSYAFTLTVALLFALVTTVSQSQNFRADISTTELNILDDVKPELTQKTSDAKNLIQKNSETLTTDSTDFTSEIPKDSENSLMLGNSDPAKNSDQAREELRYFNHGARIVNGTFSANKIIYADIWPHTDLLVTMLENGVKEDIILKNNQAPLSFEYLVETVGLRLELTTDGGYEFLDRNGQKKFYTPAPDLTDTTGQKITTGVYYDLAWGEDTEVETVEASADVLVEETVVPVEETSTALTEEVVESVKVVRPRAIVPVETETSATEEIEITPAEEVPETTPTEEVVESEETLVEEIVPTETAPTEEISELAEEVAEDSVEEITVVEEAETILVEEVLTEEVPSEEVVEMTEEISTEEVEEAPTEEVPAEETPTEEVETTPVEETPTEELVETPTEEVVETPAEEAITESEPIAFFQKFLPKFLRASLLETGRQDFENSIQSFEQVRQADGSILRRYKLKLTITNVAGLTYPLDLDPSTFVQTADESAEQAAEEVSDPTTAVTSIGRDLITNDLTVRGTLTTSGTNLSIDDDLLYLDSDNDRVGIGTTAPSSVLEVNANTTTATAIFAKAASSGVSIPFLVSADYQGRGFIIGQQGMTPSSFDVGGVQFNATTYGGILQALSNIGLGTIGDLVFQSAGGRVGIGNTAPTAQLHVKGSLSTALTGTLDTTDTSAIVTGTSTIFNTELAVDDAIKIGLETFTVASIESNTSLTLNSASTVTASGVTAYKDSNLFALDDREGINKVTVVRSGNVGIGTTAPNNLLEVQDLISFKDADLKTQIGYQAGRYDLGQYNTYIGYQAGYGNEVSSTVDADKNTAVGYQALYSLTTAIENSALGYYALTSTTTGISNAAVGYYALSSNTTGYENSALGERALTAVTTGYRNSAIGRAAGRTLTTGYNNVFIGYHAGYHASQKVDAVNSMALGNGTYTTADNQVVIGNTSITQTLLNGNVGIGIGMTAPTAALEVNGGVVFKKITADPCGAGYPEGVQFYNDTSDYFCFCDGSGVDKKVSDNGACF